MKKKIWIRVLGWIGLISWLVVGFAFFVHTNSHDPDMRNTAESYAALALFVGLPSCFVWFWASIIDGILRRKASLQGAALAQALAGRGAQPAPPAPWPTPAAAAAPGVAACAQCGAPGAQWWCYQHAVELCDTCGGQHRLSFPACTWAQRQPAAPAPAPRPRAVVTSPLAGVR